MKTGKFVYGYRVGATDSVAVTDGLWDFIETYMHDYPAAAAIARRNGWRLVPPADRHFVDMPTYYNNFEVRMFPRLVMAIAPVTAHCLATS